jgi:hypothetical protein
MTFLREGSAAIMLVTLTLSLQCAGMAAVIFLGKNQLCSRSSQVRANPFRHVDNAIDGGVHLFAVPSRHPCLEVATKTGAGSIATGAFPDRAWGRLQILTVTSNLLWQTTAFKTAPKA